MEKVFLKYLCKIFDSSYLEIAELRMIHVFTVYSTNIYLEERVKFYYFSPEILAREKR